MNFDEEFDGVWACASLLHSNEKELPEILSKIYKALKNNGTLYVSFKYGEGVIQRDDRTFMDFTEKSIIPFLEEKGFEILDSGITTDVRSGRENEKWTNVIVVKKEI